MPGHPHDPQTYAVIGAAMAVHQGLGPGFLESTYVDALCLEFDNRGIPWKREVRLHVEYRGHSLPTAYRADLICNGNIIVEAKAVSALADIHEAQLIHYLRATRINKGLLINFGGLELKVRRFVYSPDLFAWPRAPGTGATSDTEVCSTT